MICILKLAANGRSPPYGTCPASRDKFRKTNIIIWIHPIAIHIVPQKEYLEFPNHVAPPASRDLATNPMGRAFVGWKRESGAEWNWWVTLSRYRWVTLPRNRWVTLSRYR